MRALALALALWAGAAGAHELTVFAKAVGGVIEVQARFTSGKVPVAGTVQVFDEADRLVATGALGPDGRVAIPRPAGPGGLRVALDLGQGHDGYWILTAEDLAQ